MQIKPGNLVHVCPGDPTLGVVLAPDINYPNTRIGKAPRTFSRTLVFFDNEIFSVPTFQLEVVDESR